MVTYKTLMVHLELGQPNTDVLRVTADLAERFDARVIGIAACQLAPIAYSTPYMIGQEVAICQDELERELRKAEADFRASLKARTSPLEWRSTVTCSPLPEYLAGEARCADLIITGAATASPLDSSRHTSIGDLVLRAGRPVLVVPHGKAAPTFDKIALAWKDTREARRAATDALPFLRQAKHCWHDHAAAQSLLRLI